MQSTLGQVQERTPVRRTAEPSMPTGLASTVKEIPYDYVARFNLNGKLAGNRVQDVINISVDGAFIAVAIGYSFIPNAISAFSDASNAVGRVTGLPASLIQQLAACVLVRLCGIDFKYSIIDSSTGRELQNLPLHNIAGLGESSGQRPFRPMAKPMLFQPRSTIRIEIEEISVGQQYENAQLYMVLHGYKLLGYGTG